MRYTFQGEVTWRLANLIDYTFLQVSRRFTVIDQSVKGIIIGYFPKWQLPSLIFIYCTIVWQLTRSQSGCGRYLIAENRALSPFHSLAFRRSSCWTKFTEKHLHHLRDYDAGDKETMCRNVKLMSKLTALSQRQPPAFCVCSE